MRQGWDLDRAGDGGHERIFTRRPFPVIENSISCGRSASCRAAMASSICARRTVTRAVAGCHQVSRGIRRPARGASRARRRRSRPSPRCCGALGPAPRGRDEPAGRRWFAAKRRVTPSRQAAGRPARGRALSCGPAPVDDPPEPDPDLRLASEPEAGAAAQQVGVRLALQRHQDDIGRAKVGGLSVSVHRRPGRGSVLTNPAGDVVGNGGHLQPHDPPCVFRGQVSVSARERPERPRATRHIRPGQPLGRQPDVDLKQLGGGLLDLIQDRTD